MSKKLSLILAIVIALLGIVFVSVFGKLPEYLIPKVYMQKLYFSDSEIEITKSGNKVLYFAISYNNLVINLDDMVVYEPNDTTDISVTYTLDDYSIASVTSTGLLVFEESVITTFIKLEVTVTSKDGSNLKDKLIIQNENIKGSFEESYPNFEF